MMNDILSLVDLVEEDQDTMGLQPISAIVSGNSGTSAGCGSGISNTC